MRISDDRYGRDFRTFHVGLWMLRLGARTSTISAWTGISYRRVEHLFKSHLQPSGRGWEHRRGPAPTQLGRLVTNPGLRCELAALGGLFRYFAVIPEEKIPNARQRLPNVTRGERLCASFELLRLVVPNARLTLERAALLAYGLAEGERWVLEHCESCRAIILSDRLSLISRLCVHCQRDAREQSAVQPAIPDEGPEGEVAEAVQADLFESITKRSSREQPHQSVVKRQQQQGAHTQPQHSPEREGRKTA